MFWTRIHRLSQTITARMALSFAVASACILLVLSYGLYSLVNGQLTKDDRDVLADAVSLLTITLREQDNNQFLLNRRLPEELNAFHFNRYQVRLLAKSGQHRVLFQSLHFPTALISRFGTTPLGREETCQKQGRTYLILQVQGLLGDHNPQPILIQTALETTARVNTLLRLKNSLIQLVCIGVFLFSVLGMIVVRLGLRPLRQFSHRIQGIRMDSLDARINIKDWPSELGPLADSFNRLLGQLEKDVDQLTRFSGDLAHELRTPITNLRVETEVLLEKARTVEEYRAVLEGNLIELERLSKVIDRILLLAKMDSPQLALEMTPCQMAPLVSKLFDFYALLAEEKEINLSLTGDCLIFGDEPLVEQAVGNILSNAIKYTPPKGHVRVRLFQEANQAQGLNQDNLQGVVCVQDDGPGISPEHLPHIFERFYRVDSSRSQIIAGDGLGLAIVKAIMDVHDGDVVVHSESGQGSDFRLCFPTPPVESVTH